MKSKMLWIVVEIAACFFIGTLANTASKKYVDRPATAVKKAEPQAEQRARIDASEPIVTACTSMPSCRGPVYNLSGKPCNTHGNPKLFGEGCYICELGADIRARAADGV